jgi:hypothetical protein
MSKLKQELLARKKVIQEKLKTYYDLVKDLEEINKAIEALEGPKCSYGCPGCAICRCGPNYR